MSEAKIIDGKAFAAELRARVCEAVAALKRDPGLTPVATGFRIKSGMTREFC